MRRYHLDCSACSFFFFGLFIFFGYVSDNISKQDTFSSSNYFRINELNFVDISKF